MFFTFSHVYNFHLPMEEIVYQLRHPRRSRKRIVLFVAIDHAWVAENCAEFLPILMTLLTVAATLSPPLRVPQVGSPSPGTNRTNRSPTTIERTSEPSGCAAFGGWGVVVGGGLDPRRWKNRQHRRGVLSPK